MHFIQQNQSQGKDKAATSVLIHTCTCLIMVLYINPQDHKSMCANTAVTLMASNY